MSSVADDILNNLDIVDVVGKYVSLKRIGKNYVGICPFHREKTPSFTVAQDKQIYKCFGCGVGGNAIKFIMDIERIDFWDAVKLLAKDANVDISKYDKDSSSSVNINTKEKYKLINKKLQSYFQESLPKSDIATKYIYEKRKLTPELVKHFGIGFAPDSNYEYINNLRKLGFTDDDLINAGIARRGNQGDIYNFFKNRLIFPIYDHMGGLVAFSARALNPDDMPKYINTTSTAVYDKSKVLYGLDLAKNNIREFDKLIFVEGYMDVIAFHRAGLPVSVASCGTSLTSGHIKLAKRYTTNFVFAFDNDDAGFEATVRALGLAYQDEVYPMVFVLDTDYKDFDEFIVSNPSFDMSKFEGLLQDGFTFVLEKLITKYGLNSPISRKNIQNTLFDMLINIKDYSILMFYIEKFAQKLHINETLMLKQFQDFAQNKNRFTNNNKQPAKKDDKVFHFFSLFYDDFISKNSINLSEIKDMILELYQCTDDKDLHRYISGDISPEEKQSVLESQLRWEKQFTGLDNAKKDEVLKRFLMSKISDMMKIINKCDISQDQKYKYGQQYQRLTKNVK